MRTKLFHTIVLCGASLGGAIGCSGGGGDSGEDKQNETGVGGSHAGSGGHCAAELVPAPAGGAGADTGAEAGSPATSGTGSTPCVGWPPTK